METLDPYLERLASEAPVPGGGSAATIVAAIGAALVAMVGRIASGRPESSGRAAELVASADRLRAVLLEARARDEAAFGAVIAAQALPKEDDAQKRDRRSALEKSLEHAASEPLRAAEAALEVLQSSKAIVDLAGPGLVSDAGCAAEFAHAAVAACAYNVRVNHRFMRNDDAIAAQAARLRAIESAADEALADTRALVAAALAR